MADALAVTALGIEVCKGLKKAIGAWKSFNGDRAATQMQIERLTETFALVESHFQASSASTDQSRLALKCLSDCKVYLELLRNKLYKLNGNGVGPSHTQTAQQVLYPLSKSEVSTIRESMGALQNNLSLALKLCTMNQHNEFSSTVVNGQNRLLQDVGTVSTTLGTISTATTDIQSNVQQLPVLISDSNAATVARLSELHNRQALDKAEILQSFNEGNLKMYEAIQALAAAQSDVRVARRQECLMRQVQQLPPSFQTRYIDNALEQNQGHAYNSAQRQRSRIRKRRSHRSKDDVIVDRTYRFRIPLISRLVVLSFCATTGAGGISLAPRLELKGCLITDSPVKDLILQLAHERDIFFNRLGDTIDSHHKAHAGYLAHDISVSFKEATKTIMLMFQTGRASPVDFYVWGNGDLYESIIHAAIRIFIVKRHWRDALEHTFITTYHTALIEFITSLVAFGAPVNETDSDNRTPLVVATHFGGTNHEFLETLVSVGCECYHEVFESSREPWLLEKISPFIGSFMNNSIEDVMYALDLNETMQAVRSGDLSILDRVLKRQPVERILARNNPLSCTALDIACALNIPEVVERILVRLSTYATIGQLSSPLSVAISKGSFEVVSVLLQQVTIPEFSVIADRDLRALPNTVRYNGARGVKTAELVVRSLKDRRMELLALATRELPRSEYTPLLTAAETLLDGEPIRDVYNALARISSVPQHLRPSESGSTVYHCVCTYKTVTPSLMEMLWQAGFRDIDPRGPLFRPLRQCINRLWFNNRDSHYSYDGIESTDPLNLAWMLAKGAKLDVYEIRDLACIDNIRVLEQLFSIIENSGQIEVLRKYRDGCRCACSIAGCTYFSLAYKMQFQLIQESVDPLKEIPEWINEAIAITEDFNLWQGRTEPKDETTRDLYAVCMRTLLFEALGLSHTCCRYSPYCPGSQESGMNEEDALEVQDEQGDGIEQLEGLMVLVHEKMGMYSGTLNEFLREFVLENLQHLEPELDEEDLREHAQQVRELGITFHIG